MESERFDRAVDAMSRAMPRRAAIRRISAGGLAAGLLAGSTPGMAGAQSSLASAATEAAARRAINAINQALAVGDMTVLDLAFATDYLNHTPHRSAQTGQLFSPDLAGLEAGLIELRAAVPDAVLVVDDVVASGDTAAVRITFRGTVDPAVIALPEGASSRLSIGGIAMGRIVDGRVAESWDYDEAAELVDAIAKPAPTPTPEPTAPPVAEGEPRDVKDFQEVALEGIGTLVITQADTESLTIEAEPKVLARIETEVRRGKLTIRPERSFRTREDVTYHLTVKQLTSIELSGAGAIESAALATDQLRLSIDQAGSLTIDSLTANSIEVAVTGNGSVTLAGTTDEQTVTLSGTGTYDGADLQSRVAAVTVEGAAQAVVNVTESLEARAGGAASIQYLGNPEVREDVSAAGSVVNVG